MEICSFYICSSVKPGNNNSLATINTHVTMIVATNFYLLPKTSELIEEPADSRPEVRNIQDVADNILLAIKSRNFPRTGLLGHIQIRGGRQCDPKGHGECHSVLGARQSQAWKVVWEQCAHLKMRRAGMDHRFTRFSLLHAAASGPCPLPHCHSSLQCSCGRRCVPACPPWRHP